MNKTNKRITALALLLIFLLGVCGCKSPEQIEASQNNAANAPRVIFNEAPEVKPNTLTVTGEGEVTAEPDSAEIVFSAVSRGKDATEVQENNNTLIAAVTEAILANGVPQRDIKTAFINMYETYDYSKEPAALTGYEVSNSLTVRINDIAVIGQLVSDATAAGASSYSGPNFSLSDTSAAYNEALQAAVADANAKAQAMAEAADAALLPLPVSISEQGSSTVATLYRAEEPVAEAAAADNAQVPVNSGELTVKAGVTVIYEIKQRPAEPDENQ